MDRLTFSTDAFREHERFSAYCENVVRHSCGLDLRTPDPLRFRADIDFRRYGAIDAIIHTVTTIDTIRTPQFVRDGDDTLMVMLLLNGRGHQTQFDDDHNLNPGNAIICDLAYPGRLNLVTDSKLLSLKIPRMKLGVMLPRRARFGGARLDADPSARRLLSSYLAATFNVDLGGHARAAQLHQDHIVDLVALALGTGGEMAVLAEQRGAQAARRAAVVRIIEESIADPALDPPAVAARLGITVRYVHHLLGPTGRSFSEHLLDRRLARAVELLRDTPSWPRRIADIALEVGFKDLSYFNRMFRRRYGGTPSEVRHAAIRRRIDIGAADR
jgi:AraC-like DNA-binding protein